jgi:hypothetical protein
MWRAPCERGNEHSDCIKREKSLGLLRNHSLLKKDSAPWSLSISQSVLRNTRVRCLQSERQRTQETGVRETWLKVSAIMKRQMMILRLHNYKILRNFPPEDYTPSVLVYLMKLTL